MAPGTIPVLLSATTALHEYSYELRRGDELIATGLVRLELPLAEGDQVALSGWKGIVRLVVPAPPGLPSRLVVQLLRND